jgi:signal transduction histidine kinase/CheY-like chemotaxis protein
MANTLPSRTISWLVIASIILLGLGWSVANWRAGQINSLLRERILLQAEKVANNLPLEDAKNLTFTAADLETVSFQRIRSILESYAAAAGIRSLYTMALRPDGKIVFGPESLSEGDPLASPPGTIYEDTNPEDYLALREGFSAVFGPLTDEYGTFVSAVAPVFHPRTGEVILVVGLDVEASQWKQMLRQAKLAPWLVTCVLILVLWILGGFYGYRRLQMRPCPAAACVCLFGLAIALSAAFFAFESASLREKAARSNSALTLYNAFERALAHLESQLDLLSAALENPTLLSQEQFARAAEVLARSEAVQAVFWAPRLTSGAADHFELDPQGNRQPVGLRSDYYPARLIHPIEENEGRLGFDVGSDPIRREAIERSLLSGLPESTSAIFFVHDPPEKKSLALYLVRRDEANLPIGLFGCGVRISELWSKLLRRQRNSLSDFSGVVLDVTKVGNPVKLVSSGSPAPTNHASAHLDNFSHLTLPLFFGGRVFSLNFDFASHRPSIRVWQETLAVGGALALFSILGAILLGNQKRRQEELEKAVSERTAALRESNRELAKVAEEAKQADRAKSAFLATMSHEIRTPLNGVLGFAQLLSRTALSHEQAEFVRNINLSSESLLALLSDVLDYSKIEAGRLELESIPFSLEQVAREALSTVQLHADQKNLRLGLSIEPGLADVRLGDPLRIRQILVNFLANAVKFTPEGGKIELSMQPGNLAESIRMAVTDTGIGIPTEKQALLFLPFSQADSSNTREFGGSGLGLAICRKITERMGGQIGFSTEVGVGSTFYVELPLPVAQANLPKETLAQQTPSGAATSPEPSREPPRPSPPNNLRVLIAEDNLVNQKLLLMQMRRLGLTPTLASDGKAALAAFAENPAEVVILDCQMPEMDGPEVAQKIREWEAIHRPGQRARIIALTADAQADSRRRALASGMDDYLTKPLRLADLEAILLSVQRDRPEPKK